MSSRRCSTRRRTTIDYRQLANVNTRSRRIAEDNDNVGNNEGTSVNNIDNADESTRLHSVHSVPHNLPPLREGEVQCTTCLMRFTDSTAASAKHGRHHPDCPLFDRLITCNIPDTGYWQLSTLDIDSCSQLV